MPSLFTNNALTTITSAITATTTSSITYTSIFAPGVGTGSITEAGIFNASSSGIMCSRTTFLVVSKQASDQLSVIWTINIS